MKEDIAIPAKPALSPETAFLRLQAWYGQQQELSKLKTAEILERKNLTEYYFPEPVEGTNRLPLGGGFDLKLGHSLTRNVDVAALDNVKAKDIKKHKLNLDELFPMKPTLSKTAYNALSDEQRAYVDTLLDIKEGSPSLAIVAASDKEGQARHAAQAEAGKAASASQAAGSSAAGDVPDVLMDGFTFVDDAEQAEPGNYFTDGETVWRLSDEYEWVEATDPRVNVAKRARKPRAKKVAK